MKSIQINGSSGNPLFAGKLWLGMRQELSGKQERMQKRDQQVEALEQSIAGLKDSSMDPEKKLELFHNLKAEIEGVKKAYNMEQQFKTLEEARELGEKIAEQAEKSKPKTPEERREEMVEEALGIEDEGILSEFTEELEALEELSEELEEIPAKLEEESMKKLLDMEVVEEQKRQLEEQKETLAFMEKYEPLDIRV